MTGTAAWYYAAGDEKQGPLDLDQMIALARTRSLDADTLVWSSGMPDWAPIGRSPLEAALRDAGVTLADRPPPLPTSAATLAGSRAPTAPTPDSAEASADRRVTGFVDAVTTCLRNYATFRGRAARPEFWWFMLFTVLVGLGTAALDLVIFDPAGNLSPLNTLSSLALLLPSLAVSARRLHDIDRTAWWILVFVVPVLGWILAIVFHLQRGSPGANRFGPPPT
jgi:uncharacterized membrane protein YhaH (DUF805 family)